MAFPVPHLPPRRAAEPPPSVALVRMVTHDDVEWLRPIFRAPPLELSPKAFDAERLAAELRGIGLVER